MGSTLSLASELALATIQRARQLAYLPLSLVTFYPGALPLPGDDITFNFVCDWSPCICGLLVLQLTFVCCREPLRSPSSRENRSFSTYGIAAACFPSFASAVTHQVCSWTSCPSSSAFATRQTGWSPSPSRSSALAKSFEPGGSRVGLRLVHLLRTSPCSRWFGAKPQRCALRPSR